MRTHFWGFACTWLVACSSGDGSDSGDNDSGWSGADPIVLTIASPADGSVHQEGAEIFLAVQAKGQETGESYPVDEVVWTLDASAWTFTGNQSAVFDFPAGVHQLTATAMVNSRSVQDVVSIEVVALPVDLSGTVDAMVEISDGGSFTFDDECKGQMVFVVDGSSLSGSGGCTAFDEQIDFLVTGTVSGSQISGEMGVSGGEENVAFSGTWNSQAKTLSADFDQTWTNPDGYLRIWGSFQASAD